MADQRAERAEQQSLAGKTNVEATITKETRMERLREKTADIEAHPRRVARVGKPLHR